MSGYVDNLTAPRADRCHLPGKFYAAHSLDHNVSNQQVDLATVSFCYSEAIGGLSASNTV
jgi:hypothetical protein